jgi:serine/threonine-protein kinase
MSSFAFKGKEVDPRAVGERLKVSAIIEGSVRKAGSRLRVAAQLISVADGYHLWSETYDRELGDVFALQDEIARTVVGALRPRLLSEVASPLVEAGTDIIEAYTLYLRGRYFQMKLTAATFENALHYYEQAVGADPRYGRAYAGMADCYAMLGFDEFGGRPPEQAVPRAKVAVAKALELDPHLVETQCVHAIIGFLYDWDWLRAAREFEQLVTGSPPYSHALHWYALFLGAMGRHGESLRVIDRALAADPLAVYIHVAVARCLRFAGRFDQAIRRIESVLEMEPHSLPAWVELGRNYFLVGRPQDAARCLTELMGVLGRLPVLVAYAAGAYAASGATGEARSMLAELRSLARQRYVPPIYEVLALAWLGEFDEAFRLLDVAYAQRSGVLALLRTPEPRWECLRADPRFDALLKKMQLDF